jgi:hypothetical protein
MEFYLGCGLIVTLNIIRTRHVSFQKNKNYDVAAFYTSKNSSWEVLSVLQGTVECVYMLKKPNLKGIELLSMLSIVYSFSQIYSEYF